MPPRATIVVVTYDGRRFLDEAITSLSESTFMDHHILLVDNGSSDHVGVWAAERFPLIEVLRVDPNAGYAAGANRGLERALEIGSPYIGLCNDDVRFDDPDWLAAGIESLEQRMDAGMIGFQEAGPERTIPPPATNDAADTKRVNGFAMLFRAEALRIVGLHDEVYFVYADEDDLQKRLKVAGYSLLISNRPVYHFGSGTNAQFGRFSAYLQMRNGLRYSLKHCGIRAGLGRIVRMLDVACSPWPLSIDRSDVAHLRMRNEGRLLVNLGLAIKAVAWNVMHLRETVRIRDGERIAVRAARAKHRKKETRAAVPANHKHTPLHV